MDADTIMLQRIEQMEREQRRLDREDVRARVIANMLWFAPFVAVIGYVYRDQLSAWLGF
jgi:hypothetical protein